MISEHAARERDVSRASNWLRADRRSAKTHRWGASSWMPSGAIVAEGWHRGVGTPHAEVDALSKLPTVDGHPDARGLTAVVTLEPCNHTGRTGPCSVALLAAGIASVYYATSDPGPLAGGGAERLRERRRERHRWPAPGRGRRLPARLADRRPPAPSVHHGQVGFHTGWPRRGRGWHEPVDHGSGRTAARARTARGERRDPRRHGHGVGR